MVYQKFFLRFQIATLVLFLFLQSLPSAASARPLWAHKALSNLSLELKGTADLRPPRTYDVQHYVIRVKFNREERTVFGDVNVQLKPLGQSFKSFNLDANDLKIESIKLDATGKSLAWTKNEDKISITLDREYTPNDLINVRIIYKAQPRRGLYFTRPSKIKGYQAPAQIWTQGEPEDNSSWFPCYDFPDDKATSEQYITTDKSELAIGNGVLVEATTNIDNTKTYHWRMDIPHSTYLVSMIVGQYAKIEDKYKDTPLEYYVYPGSEEIAKKAFGKTPRMMEWFETTFKIPFPYKRYGQTMVSEFNMFAGMENITSTTLSDSYILVENPDANEFADDLISHELAHSWFGNLVTCKDWSHLWLNEGFATFMEASFKEHTEGREAYMDALKTDAFTYFSAEAYGRKHPLVHKYYRVGSELFDATTYQKGAFVIHMLRQTVGDEIFWKAVNAYLNEYKFKAAETADLQRVFERTSGQDLKWFFDQWVYKAGFPALKITYSYDKNLRQLQLTINQTHESDAMTPSAFRLFADVQIVTRQGATRNEKIEINKRTQTFTFNVDEAPLQVWVDKNFNLLRLIDFPQAQEQMKKAA